MNDRFEIIIYANLNSHVWGVLVSQEANVIASKSVFLSELFIKNVTSVIIMLRYSHCAIFFAAHGLKRFH